MSIKVYLVDDHRLFLSGVKAELAEEFRIVGAAYELIEDGVSGRLFEAGNLDALVTALLDVTDSERLHEYQRQSALALQRWRDEVDPVKGIRRALTAVGVLTADATAAKPR